ncbi:hypothetical protein [Georgenia sp. MJ170]|uniref:hypothetical protein n=1 Tax=Georgenia sunbinii TaxID=3117728 RepID=UPI002F26B78E
MNPKYGRRATRAAGRFMDLDGPAYGDEREKAVFTEAATFGFTLGIYANLVVALVSAVLGSLVVPTVVLALLAVPTWAALWYARRHDVEVDEIADRAGLKDQVTTFAVVFGGLIVTVGAMAFTVFTGHGLVRLPSLDVVGPDATGFMASLVEGAVIGGLGGSVVCLVVLLVSARKRTRRATAGSGADDED